MNKNVYYIVLLTWHLKGVEDVYLLVVYSFHDQKQIIKLYPDGQGIQLSMFSAGID